MRPSTEANRCAGRGAPASAAELRLVQRLLNGEERAFSQLVERYQGAMLRLSRCHVPSWALAEEVVQETWAAVFDGLDRFQGRSSLRSWIFAILVNRAKTLGLQERRSTPPPAGPISRARPSCEPADNRTPERSFQLQEQLDLVVRGIDALPPAQRDVLQLRCVQERSAGETCEQLEISSVNQRVLLHRGRARLRRTTRRSWR